MGSPLGAYYILLWLTPSPGNDGTFVLFVVLFFFIACRYANELVRELGETHATLMISPSLERGYRLAEAQLTIERDTLLRKAQLFHQYLLSQAQAQFEADLARWDEEARIAHQRVRDKLLFSVEEKRAQLKAEKENGEVVFGACIWILLLLFCTLLVWGTVLVADIR